MCGQQWKNLQSPSFSDKLLSVMFWNSVSFNSAEVSDLAVVSLLLELTYEKQSLDTRDCIFKYCNLHIKHSLLISARADDRNWVSVLTTPYNPFFFESPEY